MNPQIIEIDFTEQIISARQKFGDKKYSELKESKADCGGCGKGGCGCQQKGCTCDENCDKDCQCGFHHGDDGGLA